MGIDFRIVLKDVDESYPENLTPEEIAVYIAEKKARAFDESVDDEVVLTADTIVNVDGKILGKPETIEQAAERILDMVIDVASGNITAKSTLLGQDDFIPWKRGVSL